MKHIGWMIPALGVLWLGVSCTEGPKRMVLPPTGEPVAPFPNPEQVAAKNVGTPNSKDLAVVLTQPTGSVYNLSAVNVGFNQPMTTNPAETPSCDLIRIEPSLPGTCRWLGSPSAQATSANR